MVDNKKAPWKKKEYLVHPFLGRKLHVLDSFPVGKEGEEGSPILCPKCQNWSVERIFTVESESPGGVPYHVSSCPCGHHEWFVILR